METVQLRCGNCQQVMAIGLAHLGSQVQCPHCQAVVQTPAPTQTPAANPETNERESIFGGPEATEDVIDVGATPRVGPPAQTMRPAPMDATIALASKNHEPQPASPRTPDPAADLATFKRRPIHDRSILPMIAMIFLVPYAIATTLFIIYLVAYPRCIHPLDMLPDPAPGTGKNKGGPRPVSRQTIHNHALAAHQKTTLGNPVSIGDIEVTPERVLLTSEGDLQLRLITRNLSKNLAFEPVSDAYVRYRPSRDKDGEETRPYTFLEARNKSVDNIFGGYLEYRKKIQGKEQIASNSVLGPGEREILLLHTVDNYRELVKSVAKSKDTFVWRVQVRRGIVKHNGKEVPTTAVIGVEFTPSQIERVDEKS